MVSVFSDESRVVQPISLIAVTNGLAGFQYSLTNLVWCNLSGKSETLRWERVSVFSDESRVVQRTTYDTGQQ